jgi:hypothetical protein
MPTTGPAVPDPGARPPRPPRPLLGPVSDGLAGALARWAADARADEAGAARARERWLRRQAEEEASVAGVLCDLAERGVPVVVGTMPDGQHRGTVSAVASAFVVLSVGAREVLLALDAVAVVRPEPGAATPVGDRPVDVELRLIDALSYLLEERARVLVRVRSGERVAGELRALGRDVVSIALDGNSRAVAYVPVESIAEIGVV